jgi:hypothetical protein
MPKYAIGSRVKTSYHNFYEEPQNITKIVRMRGKLVELELLVEQADGERYWVKAVIIRDNREVRAKPESFNYVPLVEDVKDKTP